MTFVCPLQIQHAALRQAAEDQGEGVEPPQTAAQAMAEERAEQVHGFTFHASIVMPS